MDSEKPIDRKKLRPPSPLSRETFLTADSPTKDSRARTSPPLTSTNPHKKPRTSSISGAGIRDSIYSVVGKKNAKDSSAHAKSLSSSSGASIKAGLSTISNALTGKKNEEHVLVTVKPSSAAAAYFKDEANITFVRSSMNALFEQSDRSEQQIKWIQKLDQLTNMYILIVNQLALTINEIHDAGIDTTHFLNAVKNKLRFINFTTYKSFFMSCEPILLSISTNRNTIIKKHLNIAIRDTQRFIEIIKSAEEIVVKLKKKFEKVKTQSNNCMQDLTNSLSKFPKSKDIQKANQAATEIDLLKMTHFEIVDKVLLATFENTVLSSLNDLNYAHSALLLTLSHLLPRKENGCTTPVVFRRKSVFEK